MVKAWETKVFPTIRRRFRNEAERKSGLDQIKGALQLGMAMFISMHVVLYDVSKGGDNTCVSFMFYYIKGCKI